MNNAKKGFVSVICTLAIATGVCLGGVANSSTNFNFNGDTGNSYVLVVHARDNDGNPSLQDGGSIGSGGSSSGHNRSDAENELRKAISEGKSGDIDVSDNTYKMQGGGRLTYAELVQGGTAGSTDAQNGLLNADNFSKLKVKEKEKLLSDMIKVADDCVASKDYVYTDTKTAWLNDIQCTEGIGTELMASLLANVKPDYAAANTIIAPFNGIIGTILGLIAILLMALLAITMGLDLCYIGLPATRLIGADDKNGNSNGKGSKPWYISFEAFTAVCEAENEGGGGGNGGKSENKVAVGLYFKKRVIMLIFLGICLLYLVSGNIFTLVAWILNLLNGVTGI